MQQHVFQVYSNAPDCIRIRHFNAPNSKIFLGRGHPLPQPTPLGASPPSAPRPPPPPLKIPGSATGSGSGSSSSSSVVWYGMVYYGLLGSLAGYRSKPWTTAANKPLVLVVWYGMIFLKLSIRVTWPVSEHDSASSYQSSH